MNYVAANNAPILVSSDQSVVLPHDKMPVGHGEKKLSFVKHSITLKTNDVLYLYTDGYADQCGGPKGKKFKYKQLDELLKRINTLSLAEQETILNETFLNWKGSLEQVDDVCIIGIHL